MPSRSFTLAVEPGDPDLVAGILADLPAWFGIPESNAEYAEAANRMRSLVARDAAGGGPVGVALVDRHFPESAEIHLIAVLHEWHREGVGRALITAAEDELRADGCRIVQVKTLGAAHPDVGYAKTRLFYLGVGFVPLEEHEDLWPGQPALQLVKVL